MGLLGLTSAPASWSLVRSWCKMEDSSPTSIEIYTEGANLVFLKLSDEEGERQISVAMSPDQAYAVAVGLIGAVKHLKDPNGGLLAAKEGEIVH